MVCQTLLGPFLNTFIHVYISCNSFHHKIYLYLNTLSEEKVPGRNFYIWDKVFKNGPSKIAEDGL